MCPDKQPMANQSIGTIAENTVSGVGTVDIGALVRKIASRKASGLTIAALNLRRSEVLSGVASEWKSMNGFERKARVPDETWNEFEAEFDKLVDTQLAKFREDAVNCRTFAAHKAKDMCFVKAMTIRREEAMSLAEQHLFCNIAINAAEKRVDKAMDDAEKLAKARKVLEKLQATMKHIEACQSGATV